MEKVPYTNFIKFIGLEDLTPNYLDPTDLLRYHIEVVPFRQDTNIKRPNYSKQKLEFTYLNLQI